MKKNITRPNGSLGNPALPSLRESFFETTVQSRSGVFSICERTTSSLVRALRTGVLLPLRPVVCKIASSDNSHSSLRLVALTLAYVPSSFGNRWVRRGLNLVGPWLSVWRNLITGNPSSTPTLRGASLGKSTFITPAASASPAALFEVSEIFTAADF